MRDYTFDQEIYNLAIKYVMASREGFHMVNIYPKDVYSVERVLVKLQEAQQLYAELDRLVAERVADALYVTEEGKKKYAQEKTN